MQTWVRYSLTVDNNTAGLEGGRGCWAEDAAVLVLCIIQACLNRGL